MPWRVGIPKQGYIAGITPAERQMMENAYLRDGLEGGVHSLYHRLMSIHGPANAPTRDDVATFLRARPEAQIDRIPRRDLSIQPVLPPPEPLSRVFTDLMKLPVVAFQWPGKGWKSFSGVALFVDALTKFAHFHPVAYDVPN